MSVYDQHGYRVRFDWGLRGALECGPGATVVAVVDVLSFTTTVTVAADAGMEILPYRWRDETAASYAQERDAVLAVGRSQAGPGDLSLSPATFRSVAGAAGPERVVLPSPNGSTITWAVSRLGCEVVAVSLRNATAAAAWVRDRIGGEGTVLAIAAGEHWSEHPAAAEAGAGRGLRPAVEDLWGAGAFLAALRDHGVTDPSPEAATAAAAYAGMGAVGPALRGCVGGRELEAYGFAEDVTIAAELDASTAVPILRADRFLPA